MAAVARKARLPSDVVGILEDRLADDPLDFPAYEELITILRNKSKIDEARQTFEAFLKVLPASAYVWRQYAEMEAAENELNRVEALFGRALMASLNLDIWNYYLDYIRRTHPLSTGGSAARTVVSQAYEFVLQHVGIDIESGSIWSEYIAFLRTAPATSTWEEQQRNDQLRRTYQRAVVVPLQNVETLWREYNNFENGVNKQTARKFLNEKSPAYMIARAISKELSAIITPLRSVRFPARTTRSPSDEAYVSGWRKWIALERSDPLELDDQTQLRNRVKYAYKQCLMYCRFYPEMWYDAAVYFDSLSETESVQDNTHTKPSAILKEGLSANSKSWLLSFAFAEIEESAGRNESVRNTFDSLMSSNTEALARLEASYQEMIEAANGTDSKDTDAPKLNGAVSESDSDSDSESESQEGKTATATVKPTAKSSAAIKRIEEERDVKVKELSEEGTVAAIAYMRALRRMEGIKAARQVFAKSISTPGMSWQIYVASALMEHQYNESKVSEKDKAAIPIAVRIFSRGLKQFPDNVPFILEYLNFLINTRDDTNARALFEQTTAKMDVVKARPLFTRWYEYESMYGDLTSAQKLAIRISEADKSTNSLTLFGQRYSYLGCDPIARRDLGMQKVTIMPRLPPPHPLAFLPPPPGPGGIPPPNGFNPQVLPQYQRQATPLAPPVVLAPPPPAPLHIALLNFIQSLPPANTMGSTITFNYAEYLRLIRELDLSTAQQTLRQSTTSRQSTPQVVPAPATVVPAKRSAAAAAAAVQPIPDDLIALGRHNDPRDIYKKRA